MSEPKPEHKWNKLGARMGGRIFDIILYLFIGAAIVALPVSLGASIAKLFGWP